MGEGRQAFAQFLSTNPVGPGQYQNFGGKRGKGHSDWNKNSRFNYNKEEQKKEVGPGYYHKETTPHRFASSGVFKNSSREHSPVKMLVKHTEEPVKSFAITALSNE